MRNAPAHSTQAVLAVPRTGHAKVLASPDGFSRGCLSFFLRGVTKSQRRLCAQCWVIIYRKYTNFWFSTLNCSISALVGHDFCFLFSPMLVFRRCSLVHSLSYLESCLKSSAFLSSRLYPPLAKRWNCFFWIRFYFIHSLNCIFIILFSFCFLVSVSFSELTRNEFFSSFSISKPLLLILFWCICFHRYLRPFTTPYNICQEVR